MRDLEGYLQRVGLSDKEARIYLALLNSGSVIASDIAKLAKLNRSTTYVLLESLSERGLVSVYDENNIKKYQASPPERLIGYLEEQAHSYTVLIEQTKAVLPELKSLYSGVGPKPKIQYFEGIEGIKTAYEDSLTSSEPIRAYASIDDMHAAMPDYFPAYYLRRAARGIFIKAFFPDTPAARERITHNKKEKREAILLPKEEYAFTSELNIYDHKVVFMALREKFALIIESKEISEGFKKMFDLAWKDEERRGGSQ